VKVWTFPLDVAGGVELQISYCRRAEMLLAWCDVAGFDHPTVASLLADMLIVGWRFLGQVGTACYFNK